MGKILAVIPARAGSKGIPNKNIRLVNEKPLICYCLENALKSKYITDIVVTTDSAQVKLICNQMGIRVHWRNKNLCLDNITLDAVVYDACKNCDADYIITMQPTSPTLQVKTLDSAIKYFLKNNLDTLISVINQPHLSWRNEAGKKVPNYEKRCNRQYLPANYLETGAFLISKRECITEINRIGKKVDVYEISEHEAIDIDTYSDLKVAETYLQNNKVAFFVNGNNKIGLGHISRVLELADEFYTKPDIYYNKYQTDKSLFGYSMHNLISVSSKEEFLHILEKKEYSLIINDILDTDEEYINNIHKITKAHIVNFEDNGSGARYADCVINALYKKEDMPHFYCGENYYIVPSLFMFYHPIKVKTQVKQIFICFGGADPQNYTDRLLNIIQKNKYSNYDFIIVLGRAKENIESLMEYNNQKNIHIFFDVENMPELMSKCDIAITSRGRTGYELAILGIPTLSMAQNLREEQHQFICEENGYFYLGLNPTDYVIENNLDMLINMSYKERKEIQEKLLSHDLKRGRKRVMRLIESI